MEDISHDIRNKNGHYIDMDRRSERKGFRRTIAKGLKSAVGHHGNCRNKPAHPKIESVVNTVVYSLSKESLQYLKGPEGEQALAGIITRLAHAGSRFVATEEARRAIRLTAEEATTGLCDGLGLKVHDLGTKVPRLVVVAGGVVVGAYAVLLAVGLLLCLWRFSLFGLVQEKSAGFF